jgi:hypothetical protein
MPHVLPRTVNCSLHGLETLSVPVADLVTASNLLTCICQGVLIESAVHVMALPLTDPEKPPVVTVQSVADVLSPNDRLTILACVCVLATYPDAITVLHAKDRF